VRLLGVHDAAVEIGAGAKPQVGWNGHEYLIADSLGATVVHGNGVIGARHGIDFRTVNAIAWNGREWVVGFVRDGKGFVILLDRALNAVRPIELGAARSVRLTAIDGAVWAVHQRETDTEVFAVDAAEVPRFRIAGHARMVGAMAIVEETLHLSFLDPRAGFSAPRPFMASMEVPLELVHAAPFGSGALFAIHAPAFRSLLLVKVDDRGLMQEYGTALADVGSAPQVAVAGTTLFFRTPSQIYGLPLQPWPRQPFTLTDDAIVSLIDFAARRFATLASNGTYALAFWNQRTENVFTEATFMRAVGANGAPFGPVTQLPFTFTYSRDAAFHGDRFVLVWQADDGTISASDGGTPVPIGFGTSPAVACGPHGSFAVWRNQDGIITGTPLRDDASPHVPGGIALSSVQPESGARIDVVPQGFLVRTSHENIIVSPAGVLLSSSPAAAGGEVPLAIHLLDAGRSLVFLIRGGSLYTSVVTIAGSTQPRLLLDRIVESTAVAVIGEKPLAVYDENGQVWVTSYPGRRRAAR
jgi:hypothetical protein